MEMEQENKKILDRIEKFEVGKKVDFQNERIQQKQEQQLIND